MKYQIGQRYICIYERGSSVDCRLILELESTDCELEFTCINIIYSKDPDDKINRNYCFGDGNLFQSKLVLIPNQDKQC